MPDPAAVRALLLAAVGIYGTMSQVVVGQRTREIGVRMAFGARVEDIFRLVVGQGMRPVLAWLVLGIGAAAGISRLVASELFGMTPADPLAHAVAIGAVLIAALVALVLPARRATRVDPVTTLRSTQPSTGVQEIRRPNLLLNSLCLPDPMKLRAGE